MTISSTTIDTQLWRITMYLARRHGLDASYRMVAPLKWYISTGRASIHFLHCLLDSKPYIIGRVLAKGGSDDEVIRSLRSRIHAD